MSNKRRINAMLMLVPVAAFATLSAGCDEIFALAALADAWSDVEFSEIGDALGGYSDDDYYSTSDGYGFDSGYNYSGPGGGIGSDGETFYFIDGDSSYISGY